MQKLQQKIIYSASNYITTVFFLEFEISVKVTTQQQRSKNVSVNNVIYGV